jgi:tetratricopeptide (TPR) repeat protein
MTMRRLFSSAVLAFLLFAGESAASDTASAAPEHTLAALNSCIVAVAEIVSYNDRLLLEREYKDIINNLDFSAIRADEELISLFQGLMDAITESLLREDAKAKAIRFYTKRTERTILQSLTKTAAGGLDGSIALLDGVLNATSAYFDHKNTLEEYKKEYDDKLYELDKDRIQKLNDLQKKLFASSWKLVQKYSLPDRYRLTNEDIEEFIEAVKDGEMEKRYRRLARLSDKFVEYPPFWYFLGNTSIRCGKRDDALRAFRAFEEHRRPIFRKDPFSASVAMNIVRIIGWDDAKEIRRLLEIVLKNSRTSEWQNFLFAGIAYARIGDKKNAIECLQRNIDNGLETELNGQILDNVKTGAVLSKKASDALEEALDKAVGIDTLKNQDLLERFGRQKDVALLAKVLKDFVSIRFDAYYRKGRNDVLAIQIPQKWLIGTVGHERQNDFTPRDMDFDISVVFSGKPVWTVSGNDVQLTGKQRKARKSGSVFYDTKSGSFIMYLEKELPPTDEAEVRITHPIYSTTLVFRGEREDLRTIPEESTIKGYGKKIIDYGVPLVGQYKLLRDTLHDVSSLVTGITHFRAASIRFNERVYIVSGDLLMESPEPARAISKDIETR